MRRIRARIRTSPSASRQPARATVLAAPARTNERAVANVVASAAMIRLTRRRNTFRPTKRLPRRAPLPSRLPTPATAPRKNPHHHRAQSHRNHTQLQAPHMTSSKKHSATLSFRRTPPAPTNAKLLPRHCSPRHCSPGTVPVAAPQSFSPRTRAQARAQPSPNCEPGTSTANCPPSAAPPAQTTRRDRAPTLAAPDNDSRPHRQTCTAHHLGSKPRRPRDEARSATPTYRARPRFVHRSTPTPTPTPTSTPTSTSVPSLSACTFGRACGVRAGRSASRAQRPIARPSPRPERCAHEGHGRARSCRRAIGPESPGACTCPPKAARPAPPPESSAPHPAAPHRYQSPHHCSPPHHYSPSHPHSPSPTARLHSAGREASESAPARPVEETSPPPIVRCLVCSCPEPTRATPRCDDSNAAPTPRSPQGARPPLEKTQKLRQIPTLPRRGDVSIRRTLTQPQPAHAVIEHRTVRRTRKQTSPVDLRDVRHQLRRQPASLRHQLPQPLEQPLVRQPANHFSSDHERVYRADFQALEPAPNNRPRTAPRSKSKPAPKPTSAPPRHRNTPPTKHPRSQTQRARKCVKHFLAARAFFCARAHGQETSASPRRSGTDSAETEDAAFAPERAWADQQRLNTARRRVDTTARRVASGEDGVKAGVIATVKVQVGAIVKFRFGVARR